jgi:GxxExxY protein
MIKEQYKYSDVTSKIIGCAIEVHNNLGNGFQEVVYQRALSIEMKLQNLAHEREKELPLSYKGHNIGTRRIDFFVDKKIMVELKAIKVLEVVHLASLKAINYLEAYNMEIGLLINFGSIKLQVKRVMKPIAKSPPSAGT